MLKAIINWWNAPVTGKQGRLYLGVLFIVLGAMIQGFAIGLELNDIVEEWIQEKIDRFDSWRRRRMGIRED